VNHKEGKLLRVVKTEVTRVNKEAVTIREEDNPFNSLLTNISMALPRIVGRGLPLWILD